MKALFLVFHGFSDFNGISKKIKYQVDALRACGVPTGLCSLEITADGQSLRKVDDQVIDHFGKGILAKFKKRMCYGAVVRYVLDNEIDFLYIRSVHNSNPFISWMAKKLHRQGVRIVMEIPTYPYEGQYKGAPLKDRIGLMIDLLYRNRLAKQIDSIVTFTDFKTILGRPTIPISNGIDFSKIPLARKSPHEGIHFVAVAELHYWHGYDRIIRGLKMFNDGILLHIVGDHNTVEGEKLKALTSELGLGEVVLFHGALSGEELDRVFEVADLGIASLARHRSDITYIKTLKNREYAARGIPFIYSEIDCDFEGKPYILKVPADETAIDVESVLKFYQSQTVSPQEIRKSIENLSWEVQMKKVIENG